MHLEGGEVRWHLARRHGRGHQHGDAHQQRTQTEPDDEETGHDQFHQTQRQAEDLIAGRWYVNLKTAQYPAGEIRGPLVLKTEPAKQ